jgi:cytochrome d ubiquinol oxidase subunit I
MQAMLFDIGWNYAALITWISSFAQSNADSAVPMTVVGIYVHGFFLILAIGLPYLVLIYEALGIIRKDREYTSLARTVSKVFGASFAFGVITGTFVEFGLIQLWSGTLVALGTGFFAGMYIETYFFMAEIVLYASYLYLWDRFENRWVHWLIGLGLLVSANLSAYFILSANGWMNAPWGTGDLVKSILPWAPTFGPDTVNHTAATNLVAALSKSGSLAINDPQQVQTFSNLLYDPFITLFNPNGVITTIHTVLACIVIANFEAAAVFSYRYLKAAPDRKLHYLKALKIAYGIAALATILVPIAGDQMARLVYDQQYVKFTGLEGFPPGGGVEPINGLLLYFNPNFSFQGLNNLSTQVGQSILPSVAEDTLTRMQSMQSTIFPMYLTMVISGIILFIFAIGYFGLYLKPLGKLVRVVTRIQVERFIIFTSFPAAVLGALAASTGWAVREEGRLPWVVYGLVQYSQVITPNPVTPALTALIITIEMVMLFGGIAAIYIILTGRGKNGGRQKDSEEKVKVS